MFSFVMAETSRLPDPGKAIHGGEGRLVPMWRPQLQLGKILRLAHRCQAWSHVLKFEDERPNFPRGHGTSVSCYRDQETLPLSPSGLLALASMLARWLIRRSNDSSAKSALTSTVSDTAEAPSGRRQALRHSFASRTIMVAESMPMNRKLLGHRQAHTTARYAHLGPIR